MLPILADDSHMQM